MQTRWLEFLSEYDFGIKHIKGKEYTSVRLEEKNFRWSCYRPKLPTGKGKLTTRRCTIENKGTGLPEGLRGREGWRSILLGSTGWGEESWVLILLWVLGNL
jgi:hypothetical protein